MKFALTLIDRYLIRQILFFVGLVTIILIGMDTLLSLVNELKFLGQAQYTGGAVLIYLLGMLPRKIYLFLPWICFFSFYACFSQLARQQELIILQTSGHSPQKLLWNLLWKFGIVFVLLGFFLSEYLAPKFEWWAQQSKNNALHSAVSGTSGLSKTGYWLRWKNQFIWIQSQSSQNHSESKNSKIVLNHIKILEFSTLPNVPPNLKKIQSIEQAEYLPDKPANTWLLKNIQVQIFNHKQQQIENYSEQIVPNFLDPRLLSSAQHSKHLDILSIQSLWQLIQARIQNGLSGAAYWGVFIQKLVYPILIALMMLVGMGLSWGNPRQMNFTIRTVGAIGFAFSVYFMQAFLPLLLRALGIL